MCRILSYVGPPIPLDTLLYDPPHALVRQAFRPRRQKPGRINADGWGVGWYDPTVRPEPARYRTATPMWADRRFAEISPLLGSVMVMASVRNASPGAPVEETGNSPFVAERHLFTHNGFVTGFREGLGTQLRRGLSERREAGIIGAADSEVVFAMILDRLDKGLPMHDAVREVIGELRELSSGKFNFLLTDGQTIVATRDGNSLFTSRPRGTDRSRRAGPAVDGEVAAEPLVIASEPLDDAPGWKAVPENSLLVTSRWGAYTISPL
jgi:glutamine amidotransferase